LNTLTLYSLPTLSSFVSETKEEEMEKFPNEVPHAFGHFNYRIRKRNIKEIVQKATFIYKDRHEMLPFALHGIVLQYKLQQGQPSHRPSVYNGKEVPHVEVEV